MKKILITEKDFENDCESDNLQTAIYDSIRYDLDYALYYNHFDIKIIDNDDLTVQIEKIYDYNDKDVRLSYDFNIEYGTLLSLCTDLDYAFYNSDIELWNTICKDENLINHRNVNDIYSESIFLLFSEIEEMIYNKSELLSDDEISYIVDDYEYKDLIDCDELYNYICLSMNELDKWVDNAINHWFSDELNEIYDNGYFETLHHIYKQVETDGYYECYI